MKHKVIVDCDNTLGLPGKPIDDGQAILYLLGRKDIDLIGITTVFGNGTIEEVYESTKRLLIYANSKNIPLLRGAGDAKEGVGFDEKNNEAARFLVEKVSEFPGEITILAVGVMTNLKIANALDLDFFNKVKEVVAMGGYLYNLPLRGWNKIHELNLSSDPEAAHELLDYQTGAKCSVTLMNAHICLQAPFGLEELAPIADYDLKTYYLLKEYLLSCVDQLGKPQDYLWDLLPAVYISYPELFNKNQVKISSSMEDYKKGMLNFYRYSDNKGSREKEHVINMPEYIKDIDEFYNILYNAWSKVNLRY